MSNSGSQDDFFTQITQRITALEKSARQAVYAGVPVYKTQALASVVFGLSQAAGVWEYVGLEITLPARGVYWVSGNIRGSLQGSGGTMWWLKCRLWNNTSSAYITDSQRMIMATNQSGLLVQNTCPFGMFISVEEQSAIRLYAARDGSSTPSWTTSAIISDTTNGWTTLSFMLVSKTT